MDTPRRKRRSAGAWLKHFAGLAVIGWLLWYLAERWDQLRAVADVHWYHLVGTGVGVVLTWVLMSVQGQVLLRALGNRMGFVEHLMLQLASILANYLPVRLGPVLRLHYLRRIHDLPYVRYGSLMGVRAVLLVGSCGVIGLAATLVGRLRGTITEVQLPLIFGAFAVAAAAAYWLPLPRLAGSGAVARTWSDLLDGVALIRSQPALMLRVVGLMAAQVLVVAGRLWLTFDSVQLEAPPAVLVSVAALAAVVNLLAFTMGSLGLREAVIGFATAASGFDFSRGLFAGLVDRAVLMGLAYALGALGLLYVWRRLRRVEAEGDGR